MALPKTAGNGGYTTVNWRERDEERKRDRIAGQGRKVL